MYQTSELRASTALTVPLPTLITSKSGASLDPRDEIWMWTDGPFKRRIDFSRYTGGYERHVVALKQALIPFFRGNSSAYVVNLEASFKHFVDLTGPCPEGDFVSSDLSNYWAKLKGPEAWRIGTLNALVQKWVGLSLPGMSPACAGHLAERRKPGN